VVTNLRETVKARYIARVNGSKLGFETISLIILKYTALNFFDFEIFLEIE